MSFTLKQSMLRITTHNRHETEFMMRDRITVVENILSANDRLANENRVLFDEANVYSINLMASPGAGKTSLIELTIQRIKDTINIAVIDGDVASNIDTERAIAAGATGVQINTGGECHLDAIMLQQAIKTLDLKSIDLLIVENVGNLICPAGFKLGTHKNILIASIPEGDDKPYKYPGMYRGVDALVINKIDFDMTYYQRGVEALNPGLITFPLSCKTREGFDDWIKWLKNHVDKKEII
jgi:hydrogenase nickel incorporation protein HypB